MLVELIDFTQNAREKLLFTKSTRLSMDAGLMEEIMNWPEEKKASELDYMLKTIQSSWEFVHYTFSVNGVSRAFTHQFVRTRQGSYAQQSQRTVDMGDYDYIYTGDSLKNEFTRDLYDKANAALRAEYKMLRDAGEPPQDARGILPTNVSTNIIAEFSLRTLSDMAKVRLCTRTQGEYQNVFREMRRLVISVHPWAEKFINVHCAATGVCCFPNYKECPIRPGVFDPEEGLPYPHHDGTPWVGYPRTKSQIYEQWKEVNFEAVPRSEMK